MATKIDFTTLEGKASCFSASEAIDKIQKLSYETYDEFGVRKSYFEVRNHLCILGILLNLQGSVAPRFRPMRKPISPGKGCYPIEHTLLHNDRQVIDLHWIYCQKLNVNRILGYKDLFDFYKTFDFEKASLFAFKCGAKARKANLLGLSEFDQFQLAAIETSEVKTRWKTINSYYDRNQVKLKDLFTSSRSRVPEDRLKEIPDVHKALLIARGGPSKASKLYSLMTGSQMPEKTFQRYAVRLKDANLLI